MKLKTYLRGLGIGIIVTTIVMAIALGGKKEKLSDEEIVVRARQLGMVESVADEQDAEHEKKTESTPEEEAPETKDVTQKDTESGKQEDGKPETETKPEQPSSMESDETRKQEESKEPEEKPENGQEEPEAGSQDIAEGEEKPVDSANNGEVTAGQMVNVSIVSGDDSATVSKRLEELDLVVSATQFDRFLCDNGYAKKLSPGEYEIAIGSSEETIAKIITKSR